MVLLKKIKGKNLLPRLWEVTVACKMQTTSSILLHSSYTMFYKLRLFTSHRIRCPNRHTQSLYVCMQPKRSCWVVGHTKKSCPTCIHGDFFNNPSDFMGNNYVPTEIENNEMTEESGHCKYCMSQQNPFITLSLGSIKKHRIISEYYNYEPTVYWWTLPLLYVGQAHFVSLGVSGLFCHFHFIFDRKSC